MGIRREARLRLEYAGWYPAIQLSTWFSAKAVARAVARQLLEGEPHHLQPPRWELGPRILDDRHFEFRGAAESGRPVGSRTRREDRRGSDANAPASGEVGELG